ncbi:MAG: hypothetical protein ACE5IZ_09735 [Dehalococcoidia bacterium]
MLRRRIRLQGKARDRFQRYQQAVRFFRLLLPGVSGQAAFNLVDMAVAYWDQPERFA